MSHLRYKTPELVRKEIWTHVPTYNLIRAIIAQAGAIDGLSPRSISISFKGACRALEAFQPLIQFQAADNSALRLQL